MKEARPHTSNMSPEMSTPNRGTILPAERGRSDFLTGGLGARNAFEEPEDFTGPGGRDPLNIAE
jgi:hypothetical protein